jgi:fucose permease
VLARADVGQPAQYVVSAVIIGVLLVVAISAMVGVDPTNVEAEPHGSRQRTRSAPRWRGSTTVAVFGAIAFAGMLSEGAAADWSGVHLRDTLGWTEGAAARGFVVFQVFMVLGRVVGDRVVASLGARRVLLVSAVISAVGFGAGLVAQRGWLFIAGLAALGVGLSLIVPVVFSTAAAESGNAGAAIARVSTLGYAGFLVGPPLIGQLAQWTSTTTALAVLPVLAVAVAVIVVGWVPGSSAARVSTVTGVIGIRRPGGRPIEETRGS